MPQVFYSIQPAFTGGEISKDIASRVDLDKYTYSLLQAQNVYIKPSGRAYKRPGSLYRGNSKFNDKKVLLARFNFSQNLNYMMEIGEGYMRIWKNGEYLGVELAVPFTEADLPNLRFTQSVDVMYICSRVHPVQMLSRYAEDDWRISEFEVSTPPFDVVNPDEENKITASATTGDIALTTTEDTFSPELVGSYIKILNEMPSQTISQSGSGISSSILCGNSWKIITHGTWSGKVKIERSSDNTIWTDYRTYTSSSDYNATETGDFDEYTYIRVNSALTGGSCTVDLTALPYSHEGIVKITSYTDAKNAGATVTKILGSTESTADWNFSSWSNVYGYPACATFFQDRLVFAGSSKQPNVVWMSRTGDYPNFGVEKASGQVTDDSSIQIPLISREMFEIQHLIPAQDLVALTAGNEWIISGSETVTPTKITPKVQTTRGSSGVEPQYIGNRIIYVQRRGSTVRDMGYAFESDSYAGEDLTLLAKHLIKGREIIASTYAQEPDSIIYFVRDDGVIICLTYLMEQKVYAWSRIVTDGRYESVISIPGPQVDTVYALVAREINGQTVRYIEEFAYPSDSSYAIDHVKSDCAVEIYNDIPTDEITGLNHLIGKQVQVVGDDYDMPRILYTVDEKGSIKTEQACNRFAVGLTYSVRIQLPNLEINAKDGTLQSRKVEVANVTLYLENSYGGKLGRSFDKMDPMFYTETKNFNEQEKTMRLSLLTGEKKIEVRKDEGFTTNSYICIEHSDPYPFSLSAVVREVSIGG